MFLATLPRFVACSSGKNILLSANGKNIIYGLGVCNSGLRKNGDSNCENNDGDNNKPPRHLCPDCNPSAPTVYDAWTIKEDLGKRIEALEMWAFRRMLLAKYPMRKYCNASTNGVNICTPSRSEKLQIWGIYYDAKIFRKKSWLRNIREWTEIASAGELFHLAKIDKNLRS
ncbi:jg7100 [Pararge aegeria aegeria]|uniref:Jg7100 protein n=1 Tax=Pararge aegeria aegeria TaxID=348720 RepID=A0A8S4R2N9_9NEOP|nr:jg7100 [Pararge aegeria aegeria]